MFYKSIIFYFEIEKNSNGDVDSSQRPDVEDYLICLLITLTIPQYCKFKANVQVKRDFYNYR